MSGDDTEKLAPGDDAGSLRMRTWKRFLRGPDREILDELYVPALSAAVRYDRCCAYFSSSVLAAAARGFGRLIERLESMGEDAPRPAVRLVVNEQLSREDVRALIETRDMTRLENVLNKRLRDPQDLLERERLEMLGWLAKKGFLEVRVGVMRHGEGILHAKYGIMTDPAGDAVVFMGSGNESAQGLVGNYEEIELSTSWEDPARHEQYSSRFEALWGDHDPAVHTVSLPEAVRLRLISFAPKKPPLIEPGDIQARQRAAMLWQFIVEAPFLLDGARACDATAFVDLWPHQRRVVEEASTAWPDGRLLCDEVGMGKTIQAILILRRLMAGRGVRRVLILVPAGLMRQWQAELREKGGLLVPRLEGYSKLHWPDDRVEKIEGLQEALGRDALIMSRETARTEENARHLLGAPPWDLVILDEAHAARRRKQEEGEFNSATLLLELLRQLQLRQRARGFLLLSATPMQTHPWEPWDLLQVLGEGGAWLADFAGVRDYYDSLSAVRRGQCDLPRARKAARMIEADPEFPELPGSLRSAGSAQSIANSLAFTPASRREDLVRWLRSGSPLGRRMHRNSRETLRRYYDRGLLPAPPPGRCVEDVDYDYRVAEERRLYDAVGHYIRNRYEQLEREKPGKGFVMTIYRRRASSSPRAIRESLRRRAEGLQRVATGRAPDLDASPKEEIEWRDADDVGDLDALARISSALPQDPHVARAELSQVDQLLRELGALGHRDSKLEIFYEVLRRVGDDGRPVLVFTCYTDTMAHLRDNLVGHYGEALGCYSGGGGEIWDGATWTQVGKDAITRALREGKLRVLVCTDAASEGLNLQAAGAVVNYDLPWNPSRVEQRIGRVDRIGQKYADVHVVNLFLRDSVDDRVYRVLRERCGMFEHFVGHMQPVLAEARRMLLHPEDADPRALEAAAESLKADPLPREMYASSEPDEARERGDGGETGESAAARPILRREDLRAALDLLSSLPGFKVRKRKDQSVDVSGRGVKHARIVTRAEPLEADPALVPLTPLGSAARSVLDALTRPGEQLPLVIGSRAEGGFRSTAAHWLEGERWEPVASFDDLLALVQGWSGQPPSPRAWLVAQQAAQKSAAERVRRMAGRAAERERLASRRQVSAARLRLLRELGRFITCFDGDRSDLNRLIEHLMSREMAASERLRACLERLGGYPEWPDELRREVIESTDNLPEARRKARRLGAELDAALADPRWAAAGV